MQGPISTPNQGTRPHMPQPRHPQSINKCVLFFFNDHYRDKCFKTLSTGCVYFQATGNFNTKQNHQHSFYIKSFTEIYFSYTHLSHLKYIIQQFLVFLDLCNQHQIKFRISNTKKKTLIFLAVAPHQLSPSAPGNPYSGGNQIYSPFLKAGVFPLWQGIYWEDFNTLRQVQVLKPFAR